MRKFIYLFISIFIYLSGSLNGQVINNQELEEKPGSKRNVLFNLEEIKVRWKKAALENCPGGLVLLFLHLVLVAQFLPLRQDHILQVYRLFHQQRMEAVL